MNKKVSKILKFSICGKFAHFRKFYTNASSLSYLVPPRTVITGILASVMKYNRDSYYEIFSMDKIKISVAIEQGTNIIKSTQSLNYIHPKYYNLLSTGTGNIKKANIHTQCKLELLMAKKGLLKYTVYVGGNEDSISLINEIGKRLLERDFGYGVYLGQRQFIASINNIEYYDIDENNFIESSNYVDSICLEENTVSFSNNNNNDLNIATDQMPIQMTAIKQGRELQSSKKVVFEKYGKRMHGVFNNCYKVGEKVISFYC